MSFSRSRREKSRRRRRSRHFVVAGIFFFAFCYRASSAGSGIVSFEMHPSSQLLVAEEQRRNLNELPESWLDSRMNAVYATLPKSDDTESRAYSQRHRRNLEDFHAHRHLSRYERQYRLENNLDLESNWDGTYNLMSNTTTDDESSDGAPRVRRNLQQESRDPYQAAPLSQGYGTHYAHVWVGAPVPQRKSVIVDTGSHYTAFPCKGCHECGEEHHTDPYYDFERSTTFRALPCKECQLGAACHHDKCTFSQSYTEGSSWDAFQAQDMFYCGGNNVLASADSRSQQFAIPFLFGCQTAETGLFVTQLADGIMGMSAHDFTLTKQMYDAGKLENNRFSLCFRRELATSKRGVTAGFMTLGGVDSRLDSSPMVYAKNIASSGWYTVYVRNIFIRSNGGQSATNVPEQDQHVLKIPLDLSVVNSGKGVIVDSGTTDTYLHKNLAKSFNTVWKQVTGKDYTHGGISLTRDQLLQLPTILVQCQAADKRTIAGSPEGMIGLAGRLDPSSPNDILIAIPAANYMEYSPSTNQYTSRLYFTETRGGVLGANAMQGHNVVFDWQNGRVGFAESTCEYREQDAFPKTVKDLNKNRVASDCVLGAPSLLHSCVESLDLSVCRQNPNQMLKGFEHWTRTVKNPGTETGMSCRDAGMLSTDYSGTEPPKIECDGTGVCSELRPCEVHCALVASATEPNNSAKVDPSAKVPQTCDDDWSACDSTCTQTKVTAKLHSDGLCYEQGRESRPCHTGACGRSDRCRVPFFVHTVLGLEGAELSRWTRKAEEWLSTALVSAVRRLGGKRSSHLFEAGDVDVMMTSAWDGGDKIASAGARRSGVKAVVQISVVNPAATQEDDHEAGRRLEQEPENFGERMLSLFHSMAQSMSSPGTVQRKTTCAEGDLYPQARQAMLLHDLIEKPDFIPVLVEELRRAETRDPSIPPSPFQLLYSSNDLVSQSKVISAWTIRTEELDDPILTGEPAFIRHTKRLRQYANRSPFTTMATGIFLAFLVFSTCFGSYEIFYVKHMCFGDDSSSGSANGFGADEGGSDEENEKVKLLPTHVLSPDDESVLSKSSIDELFEQLVTKSSPSTPNRTSPRRRGSLDSGTSSFGPTVDIELPESPSEPRKKA